MNVMDHTITIYLLSLSFINGLAKDSDLKYCMNMSTRGYTVPSGDIILEYGNPLNITCNLYSNSQKYRNQGDNSSFLYFKRGDKPLYPDNDYDILSETAERVEILNETSIRLIIRKPEKMREFFNCFYNNTNSNNNKQNIVCSNAVFVGIPPQPVTDFSCRSNNWETMTCSWTPPDNYVVTTYNVSYVFPEYPNGNRYYVNKAPPTDESHNYSMNFTLGVSTDPFYRASQEIYEFTIQMNNTFGRSEQTFAWHHFKNVYFKPPVNLTGISTSPSNITLKWNVMSILTQFPRNLTFRVMYKCAKFCDSWKLGKLLNANPKYEPTVFNLTNLEYANILYDIRVSMKVKNAPNYTWSDNVTTIVKTESKIPDYPPPTTLGSFQFVNSEPRQVYVYFQQIKPQAQNGEDFKYVVESDPKLNMIENTSAYAKFVGLNETTSYTMRIWSKNQKGKSKESSIVVIPSQRVKEPYKLWKIVYTSVKYELAWQQPRNTKVTNYTLFWCEHQSERPFQCVGFLNWTIVPSSILKYNITVPPSNKTYQFAIAANTMEGSSGMLWASCIILANGTPLQISELIVKSVGSTYIELNWRQDCPDLNSEVIGYVIFYCVTNEQNHNNCSTPMKNITINASLSDQSAIVTGLKPYTTYLLAVSVKTKSTVGIPSDFVRNVTLEGAPSTPPLNIIIGQITNSSVTIHWTRPSDTNGKIQYYLINYNDQQERLNGDLENYTLTNLESYKKYVISMEACTKLCSNRSTNNSVLTKMGIPSKPGRPYLNETIDKSVLKIMWNKPDLPRGEIQYYQILIGHDNDNTTEDIRDGTSEELFSLENCGAKNRNNNYAKFIRVRAVNVIDNEHFAGPWSDPYTMSSCYHNSWLIIIYIGTGIIALFLLVFGGRKMYAYCRIMQDVEVKLPAGLAPAVERSEKSISDIDRYCPDEELLLEKIAEKCPTGDSSGCSSGQESITSSVESTTHLSIDSGTDQPRNVSDDNKENSLRLRNVSSKGYVLHEPTPTINRGTKPAPIAAGNYCVLGEDLSNKPIEDTPYVTISDIESVTAPYISNVGIQLPYTDFFKTPNPGYVPFSNSEPASKNTGYVVAGDLSSPSVENTSGYLLPDAPVVELKPSTIWQQPLVESSLSKPAYVSVGDAPPPVTIKETGKGYVSHRQFEAKSLKED